MSSEIFYLSPNELDDKVLMRQLMVSTELTYYWSDVWEPHFYSQLAHEGFIAVTLHHDEMGLLLLPELQESYAVLDWDNLHIGKKVKRLIRKLEDKKAELRCTTDVQKVCEAIQKQFGENSWLHELYVDLLLQTMSLNLLKIYAFELYIDSELIAGEIGYLIGSVYTSLSGFYDRDRQCYANAGKLQMVLLAKFLEEQGVAFWNLGHPQLEYKLSLGATVLPRHEFLKRWRHTTGGDLPSDLAGSSYELQ